MNKREKIIYLLEDKDAHFTSNWVITDQILALFEGWVELDENQKLPEYVGVSTVMDRLIKVIAEEAQQDMLKTGFRRIKCLE